MPKISFQDILGKYLFPLKPTAVAHASEPKREQDGQMELTSIYIYPSP